MANQLTRWTPFRDIMTMQNMMDRFFEDAWRPLSDESRLGANPLALDVHEDDTSYTLSTDLPGVKAEDIQVKLDGDVLVIDAETRSTTDQEGQQGRRALVQERRYGRYSRRIRLPHTVNIEHAEAHYQDGVLTLRLPKAEAPQARLIQVKSGNGSSQN